MWYQPARFGEDDIVLVDGEILAPGMERQNSFNELFDLSINISDKKRPWHGEINGYHFVKGSLDQLDEVGRILSFDFVSRPECWKLELDKSIKAIGIGLSKDTQRCLKRKVSAKAVVVIAIIISIALIGTIIKLINWL